MSSLISLTVTEIFESGAFSARPTAAFGHMEVRVDLEASDVEDQITYLYK